MSSKTPQQSVSTSTVQLPQNILDASQHNIAQSQEIAATPWSGYAGPRVAAWSPDMTQAANAVQAGQGSSDQLIGGAAATQAGVAGQSGPGNVQAFMNPNMQAVIDEINRQGDIQSTGATRQAAARRAIGSTGDEVMQGQIAQGTQRAVGQAANTAYNQALQASMGQQQLQLMGAQGLVGTAQAGNALKYQDINALMGVGQAQRADSQQLINQAMQDFYEQRDWPTRGLNIESAALSGSPYDRTTTTSQPYYPPSVGATAVGGAVAGGGLGYQVGGPYGAAAGGILGGLAGLL